MRILLVTTWQTACGIAEHARYLVDSVAAADPSIDFHVSPESLDPAEAALLLETQGPYDLVVLNYHAALHSRWQPEQIRDVQRRGIPVVAIYHDTGVPNSDQCQGIHAAANATVIHEPAADLPGAIYWRQGVPGWGPAYLPGGGGDKPGDSEEAQRWLFRLGWRPVLGSVGFPFPWKNYDLLAAASAAAGWALLLLAPGATADQMSTWRALNPASLILPDFVPADAVVAYLSGCDATAFLYTCCNTGTSGAIRQGIAARQPVLAAPECRQFRDLYLDPRGRSAIVWTDPSLPAVVDQLARLPLGRASAATIALAAQDDWAGLGRRYARLYQQVIEAGARGRVTEQGVEHARG